MHTMKLLYYLEERHGILGGGSAPARAECKISHRVSDGKMLWAQLGIGIPELCCIFS
jgi:hypothetical protein